MTIHNDTGWQRWIPRLAAAWLVFILAYAFGYLTHRFELWPFATIQSASDFLLGDDVEQVTLKEKVLNDFGMRPARHIVESQRNVEIPEHYEPLEGLPLKQRRQAPLMYLDKSAPLGYRLLYGSFDFEDGLHGAILLNPQGQVQQSWTVRQDDAPWESREDENTYPHGIELLPDGSIIAAFDGGSSITRYGYCGEQVWRTKGNFHHSVTRDGAGAVWAWGNPNGALKDTEFMVRIDEASGAVLDAIHIDKVVADNPGMDPFAIRQDDKAQGSVWSFDRFHVNDVDPLPPEFADAYEQFDAGDLMISLRSINLVAVLDPKSRELKWWRQGLTRRQHDPDWNAQGTITIFDNNMHRDYSRIFELDPQSSVADIVVDGKEYDFYSWHRGKHDRMPQGGYLVTSSEQGRVFETDNSGQVVFEFFNRFSDNGRNLVVSEGRFFEPDYFDEFPSCGG